MLFTVLSFNTAFATDMLFATDKDSAIKACKERAANAPEAERENMQASCRCMLDHIDFDQVKALDEANDEAGIEAVYQQAWKACH